MRTGRILKIGLAVLALGIFLFQMAPIQQARAASWHTYFSEDFDDAYWTSRWFRDDLNPLDGADYWGLSTYRSYSMGHSVWCAAEGSHTTTTTYTVFSEGFESSTWTYRWSRNDANYNSGRDYWGISDYRKYSGYYSAWCAAVGAQDSYPYDQNLDVHRYDNNMAATLYRSVNLQGYSSATLSYRYWIYSEYSHDYLQVVYRVGSTWRYLDQKTGLGYGWRPSTVSIPVSANAIGFYFRSDNSAVNEGAYIDSIVLTGTRTTSIANSALHMYDDYMQARLYKLVDLGSYSRAILTYKYWLSSQSGHDYLKVLYHSGFSWTIAATVKSGNYGSWQNMYVDIPTSTTYGPTDGITFLFTSDSLITSEGAYLDDISLLVYY